MIRLASLKHYDYVTARSLADICISLATSVKIEPLRLGDTPDAKVVYLILLTVSETVFMSLRHNSNYYFIAAEEFYLVELEITVRNNS